MRRSSTLPAASVPFSVMDGKVARRVPLTVTITAYSGDLEYEGVTWVSAGQVPDRGARCLVAIDDQGQAWAFPAAPSPVQPGMVVQWVGTPPDAGWEAISHDPNSGVTQYVWRPDDA
jgi:hypothetical protein